VGRRRLEPAARSPRQTEPKIRLATKVLSWQRWTCRQIAGALAIDPSTAARILRRVGMSRRRRLEPPTTVERYEHAAVGDLLHLDTKKLGRITYVGHRMTGDRRRQPRGAGWESCTWPSTTTPASPTSNCCRMSAPKRCGGSSAA
jgi:hypothetical protein